MASLNRRRFLGAAIGTGAAAAALARGLVDSPVTVRTLAGDLELRWEGDTIYLIGPAEITARGEFYGGI